MRAHGQHALGAIQAPGPGGGRGAPLHVVHQRGALAVHFGQHQRHLRFNARKAAVALPDAFARFFFGGVRRMVGGDHVDGAVHQRVPQRLVVALFADGRIQPQDAAQAQHVLRVQQQVLRAGFHRHVHPAPLGRAQHEQRIGRAVVGDVHAGAGPLGQCQHAADGLDLGHRRARGQVRQRVDAAGRFQPVLAARHDGRVLCMHHGADAQRRQLLEAFQQRAVGGRGQVAEGVAHKGLEAGDTRVQQVFQPVDGVVAQQAVDAVVHVRGFGRLLLQAQGFQRAGGRVGVGHLEHRGHAAAGCSGGPGLPGFLVRVARVAEVHMAVDGAGQQVLALGAQLFAGRRHQVVMADGHDAAAFDGDGGFDDLLGRHQAAAADDEVCVAHARALLTAWPSRRRPAGRHR